MRRDGRSYRTAGNGPGRGLWFGILVAGLAGIALGVLTGYAAAGKGSPSVTPTPIATTASDLVVIPTSTESNDTPIPTPALTSTAATTPSAASTATPTPSTVASTTFKDGTIGDVTAWAMGNGPLQGCAMQAVSQPLIGLRLRVASTDQSAAGLWDGKVLLTVGGSTAEFCTALLPVQPLPIPGIYRVLLYDQDWHEVTHRDFTVALPPTPEPATMAPTQPSPPPPPPPAAVGTRPPATAPRPIPVQPSGPQQGPNQSQPGPAQIQIPPQPDQTQSPPPPTQKPTAPAPVPTKKPPSNLLPILKLVQILEHLYGR